MFICGTSSSASVAHDLHEVATKWSTSWSFCTPVYHLQISLETWCPSYVSVELTISTTSEKMFNGNGIYALANVIAATVDNWVSGVFDKVWGLMLVCKLAALAPIVTVRTSHKTLHSKHMGGRTAQTWVNSNIWHQGMSMDLHASKLVHVTIASDMKICQPRPSNLPLFAHAPKPRSLSQHMVVTWS